MKKLRIGVIGTGGIGQIHLGYLPGIDRVEVTCVCDNREVVVKGVARETGAAPFTEWGELIRSGLCDAVLIATPHYFHAPIAIAAMKAGLHVLTEKPIAVRTSQADKMVATAKRKKLKLAVMFQRRTTALWKKAREIIDSGALGKLIRTCMMTSWYRTQSYYDASGWRGTWSGEGGGVLVNQAPHELDLLVWLGGRPSAVLGKAITRGHKLEVEDVATAILTYPNGAVGTLYASTYEFPEVDILQFVGDRGILEVRDGKMRLGVSAPPAGEMLKQSDDPWDIPIDVWTDVDVVDEPSAHRNITSNFVSAVLDGAALTVSGEDAVGSLELANAITVSSALGKEVKLPLRRKLFDDLLDRYIKTSKVKKGPRNANRVVIPRR